MALLSGQISVSRYLVSGAPEVIDDEWLMPRLVGQAFKDIENTPEEESAGWVEALNPYSTAFEPHLVRFGNLASFSLRLDSRKIPPKVVKRYCTIAEEEAKARAGGFLTSEARKELKARVRLGLLNRALVSTTVYETVWFLDRGEVWLVNTSPKARQLFEDLWRKTFGFGLLLRIPYLAAKALRPGAVSEMELENTRPTAFFSSLAEDE